MGLYDNKESRQKIRAALLGKRIVEVEFPPMAELVAKLVVEEGPPVFLFATELGTWVGDPDPFYYRQAADGSWRPTTDDEKDAWHDSQADKMRL